MNIGPRATPGFLLIGIGLSPAIGGEVTAQSPDLAFSGILYTVEVEPEQPTPDPSPNLPADPRALEPALAAVGLFGFALLGTVWLVAQSVRFALKGPADSYISRENTMPTWLRKMEAQLIAEIAAPAVFAAASRGWLTTMMTEVFPVLHQGMLTRPVSKVPVHAARGPWGQPDHVRGVLTIAGETPIDWRHVLYNERSWLRFLAQLEEYPFGASVTINALDDKGFPVHPGEAHLGVVRDSDAPAWATFTFTAHADDTGWPDSYQVQDRWAELVKEQASRIGACAGNMTDDIWGGGQTALERALHRGIRPLGDDLREVLRGYSWITIVAAELGGRLGGANTLTASGAFCDVSLLPNGSLWLRATPTINEFTGDKVRRVFETLAPVLLTGTAKPRIEYSENFRIVEGVDAADFR